MMIDGIHQRVDCSDLPENFHALQWNNDAGEVEWKGNPRPPNTTIQDLDDYQVYIDRWYAEKERVDAEYAALLAEQANTANNTV